jgi:hypothetical protein
VRGPYFVSARSRRRRCHIACVAGTRCRKRARPRRCDRRQVDIVGHVSTSARGPSESHASPTVTVDFMAGALTSSDSVPTLAS